MAALRQQPRVASVGTKGASSAGTSFSESLQKGRQGSLFTRRRAGPHGSATVPDRRKAATITVTTDSRIEKICDLRTGDELAIVIGTESRPPGISFVTDDDSVHQLGLLSWPKGHVIDAHVHNPLERSIDSTQEVLFVRSGAVRVDLYGHDQVYQTSRVLTAGDVIFLASGGHGFEILEDADIVEVKQGPYLGEGEKTRFLPRDNPYTRGSDA